MPVLMTLRAQGDPQQLESYAQANREEMRGIVELARRHGLLAHRFYGSEDGRIMVADEWPDEASFRAFFEEAAPRIQALMGATGMTSEPEIVFWRTLESHDEVGWND
jgi:heme-degrading monooxygenase HmoA